jgi:hypothetical protein
VDAKTAEYYQAWAHEYYVENYASLRKAVLSVLRKEDARIDGLMSDIVLVKLPCVMRTWDPDKGASLDGHIKRSIKWWVYKKLVAEDRKRQVETSFESLSYDHQLIGQTPTPMLDIKELIDKVKHALTPLQFTTLQRRFVDEMSITEMAELSFISRGSVYARIEQALEAAREALNV